MITYEQCKMARAALGWSTSELAKRARVGVATVNRFETIQGETTVAIIEAMQRALESAGAIFEESRGASGGVRMRKLREGDLVRRKSAYTQREPGWKDTVGKVVQVERHAETGPTYRVWAEFPDNRPVAGLFAYQFELVKAAPEWSSVSLSDFQVLREEGDLDGVIIHSFDGQKLVLAFVPRSALEDYFHLPLTDGGRRPTIEECSVLVDRNLAAFKRIIERKYAQGEYRMLNRYGSTHPIVETMLADIQADGGTLSAPNAQFSWHPTSGKGQQNT
jgi:transcriptional regulator with XRE-family HTH domain